MTGALASLEEEDKGITMASLTDTIVNDTDSQNPSQWLKHMETALAGDPNKDQTIARALKAYLEDIAPKTLQDLLQLSKTKPSQAQVWISILPPDTKTRFATELQTAISSLSTPAPQGGARPGAGAGININKVIERVADILKTVDPTYTDDHETTEQMVGRLISSLKNHPDLEKTRNGTSNIKRLNDLIIATKNKFTDEKIRRRLHQLIADLQDDDSITESWIPVVNIRSQLRDLT